MPLPVKKLYKETKTAQLKKKFLEGAYLLTNKAFLFFKQNINMPVHRKVVKIGKFPAWDLK